MANVVLTIASSTPTAGISNREVVKFSTSGDITAVAQTITVGFVPRYVKVYNVTDNITNEYIEGFPADATFTTLANGTQAYATTGGITVYNDTTSTAGTVMLDPAIALASKTFYMIAEG